MTQCERHSGRHGILTVDLPSIGIRRYMCLECRMAFELAVSSGRAYATGLGHEAHREAQEAARFDQQLQEGKLHAKVRKYL